jgi:hypothetical protein
MNDYIYKKENENKLKKINSYTNSVLETFYKWGRY